MCDDVLNKRNIGDWMKIIFTGGGTAGHISLNLALIPHFIELGYEVHYIGSKNGMEKEIIKELKNVKYHEISTGKLRRYFSIENFKDPFRVINGVIESKRIIKKIKPNIVFSKGGFVSLPVVIGAKLNNVPVVAHESDLSAGLANKLASPFCKKIFLTFEDKNNKFKEKGEYVGALVREEIKTGNKEKGKKICNINNNKPTILVMGGSLGARSINEAIWDNIDEILKDFNVIHICGKNSLNKNIKRDNYIQFEFVKDELKHIFKVADMVISRAGANSIFEFLSLNLPMLLIPLPLSQSRGDQIENAKYFKSKGYCNILEDEKIKDNLLEQIKNTYKNSNTMKENMKNQKEIGNIKNIVNRIIELQNNE